MNSENQKPNRDGWTLPIGRMFGIDVRIHLTFLLLLGFIGVSHWLATGSVEATVGGLLFFAAIFLCVLLHEFGHALAARRYGIRTHDITLLPIGGVARLERLPSKPSQELVVALAGPAVNVVIAAVLGAVLWLGGVWEPLGAITLTSGNLAERLLLANVFLVLFNMLPAFPMDGGRVLRALLGMRMKHVRATRIAARVGQGMAVLFGLAGLFGNPMLVLVAFFVWVGAAQEAAATEMKASFAGATVREAMLTDFRTLSPEHTLRDALNLVLAGSQEDFPVVSEGRVVGMLPHSEIFRALRERDDRTTVVEIMSREFAFVCEDTPLDESLAAEQFGGRLALPVLRDGMLAGMLTSQNICEFFLIRSAGRHHSQPPPRGGATARRFEGHHPRFSSPLRRFALLRPH